jgi:hypothetical protein
MSHMCVRVFMYVCSCGFETTRPLAEMHAMLGRITLYVVCVRVCMYTCGRGYETVRSMHAMMGRITLIRRVYAYARRQPWCHVSAYVFHLHAFMHEYMHAYTCTRTRMYACRFTHFILCLLACRSLTYAHMHAHTHTHRS